MKWPHNKFKIDIISVAWCRNHSLYTDLGKVNFYIMAENILNEVIRIWEPIYITVGAFLIKTYVFLEPGLESKKQKIFYMITAVFLAVMDIFLPVETPLALMFFIGLNISLGRKKHRIAGFVSA